MQLSSEFLSNLVIEIILSASLILTSVVYTILWLLLPKAARCKRTTHCWTQKAWLLIMISNGIFGIVFLTSSIAILSNRSFYGLYGMFFLRITMLIMLLSTTLMVVSSLIKDFTELREMQDFILRVENELADYEESVLKELHC